MTGPAAAPRARTGNAPPDGAGGPHGGGGSGSSGSSRGGWVADLAMGARFAFGGGREGWARTALTAIGVGLGVAVLLLAASVPQMIGASMVVSTLEQLRERKRLLSVLVAFGTRRSTLAWSVLWQAAVPVALGMALAAVTGLALGVALLRMTGQPLGADWLGLGAMTGLGGALILLVTLVSMPVLWRLMRPDGLRTE